MFIDRIQEKYIEYPGDISKVIDHLKTCETYKTKKLEYVNIPAAFDIETTSFFEKDGEVISTKQWAMLGWKDKLDWTKKACMYIWQLGLDGFCIIGRTWESFSECMDKISDALELGEDKRIILFVHNLSFEFNFLKHRFNWVSLFATKPYMPLYAASDNGFEFRCSYRNTNKKLEEVGEDLLKYKVDKKVGDLDYDLIRNSQTVLTDKEIGYCINDIKVVMCYIQEQIEEEKKVDKIPLTKTGYVRRDVKNRCFKDVDKQKSKLKRFKYRRMISGMELDLDNYLSIRAATLGGFTHGSAYYAREVCEDVAGMDIASSYPAIMLSNMFPMSSPKKRQIKSLEELEMYCKYYCCIFTVEFENIYSVFDYDSYISVSRCQHTEGVENDNGRIRSAEKIITTITNVDYDIIKRWYKWDKIKVKNFYTMIKDYLPKDIILAILDYYEGKTQLKGIAGKEAEYMRKKAMLNSIYGMTLTSIINGEIELQDGSWKEEDLTEEKIEELIEKYNENKSRFLYYPWGTFVTAYGRRNITQAIFACGKDYIYTDTDSIKLYNYDKHKDWFDAYNENITKKVDACLSYYEIDPERGRPADQNGKKRQIGIFEFEGKYRKFKTLGAKRYIYEDDKGLHVTVAGLGKAAGSQELSKYPDAFEAFDDKFEVDGLHTGKLTHTYIETHHSGQLTDYQGNTADYDEMSAVHLCPCEFSMTMANEYLKLIQNLRLNGYNEKFL